jgi:hypothetical protein
MILLRHEFEGDGRYCEHENMGTVSNRNGTFTFRSQCAHLRESHGDQPTEAAAATMTDLEGDR